MCLLSCFSSVQLFVTLWTVAHQAPLSMGILQPRILEQVAMPSCRDSPRPKDQNLHLLYLLHWQAGSLLPGKPLPSIYERKNVSEVAQSCLTLCDPMDSSLHQAPLSTGFFKARVLEWVAISFYV